MIDLKKTPRTVRECKAPFEYTNEKGELVTDEIRVRYFSATLAELKLQRSDIAAQAAAAEKGEASDDAFPWLSNLLAKKLESLPDICEGGKPIKITVENLDKLSAVNLRAIDSAIDADLIPKPTPVR